MFKPFIFVVFLFIFGISSNRLQFYDNQIFLSVETSLNNSDIFDVTSGI